MPSPLIRLRSSLLLIAAILSVLACAGLSHAQESKQPSPQSLSPAEQELLERFRKLPPGSRIDYEHTTVNRKAGGKGAGVENTGDKVTDAFDGKPPAADLPGDDGAGAQGGGAKNNATADTIMPKSPWANPLFWIGLVLALLGIACYAVPLPFPLPLPQRKIGATMVVAGGALVAVAFFSWLLIPLFVAVVAVLMWPWLHAEITKAQLAKQSAAQVSSLQGDHAATTEKLDLAHSAISSIAAGIEDMQTNVRQAVKAAISRHTTDDETSLIRDIKRDEGLATERPAVPGISVPVPAAPIPGA